MNTIVSVFGVEPRRIGGNESFARELSSQLYEHGWRSVLCFLTEPPEGVRNYLSLPNVSIEVLNNSWHPNLSAAKEFRRILRTYRPKIVHLHFIGFIGLFPWLARLTSANRVFFTDQGSHPENYAPQRSPFWKRLLVRMINWPITKVICVSNYNYTCMTMLDVLPTERFECIYNSVDFSRVLESAERAASFRRQYAIPENRRLITQVSWIIPEKGIPDLLEAVRLVVRENGEVQLVLVGDGSYREEYTRLAAKMGIAEHVTWTGLITDPFVAGVYDAADIVCQVSRWQEAFGWVIAEAMAYRKPVIGTLVGGIPELIENDKTGFLVHPGDPNQIAQKLLQLLGDNKLRQQMGQAGHESAVTRFNLQKNVSGLMELYGMRTTGEQKPI